ncbi:phosphatase PAP2 family protein [Halalkalibacter alkalisediminis]|uniref:Phosphatase PAP2 family protein n=1 Tax=Halalkalibacter alkalisediminis TaxID=935616 RepID=A0ABV6NCV5_9BACI|nr:phosphatase PAP2 family protein [Halalkalibacter alkalisediminis]
MRRPSFWILSVALVGLISFSRLYTGLHWPSDVLIGVMVAVIVLIMAIFVQDKIAKLSVTYHWVLAIVTSLLIIAVFSEEEGIKYAGFLLGAGIGYFA